MFWIFIIAAITAVDQFLKYFVVTNIQVGSSVVIIDNFFQLTHVENSGVAFSFFQNQNYIMIPVILAISGVVIFFLKKSRSKLLSLSLAFVLGGAIGNLIDRIFRGNVIDFLDFQVSGKHFFTFNIADMFIVIGTFMIAFYLQFLYKEKEEEKQEEIEKEQEKETENENN